MWATCRTRLPENLITPPMLSKKSGSESNSNLMPKMEQTVAGELPRAVEEWLLSVLRFAITLDEVDRAAVLAAAADMDRRGSGFYVLREENRQEIPR